MCFAVHFVCMELGFFVVGVELGFFLPFDNFFVRQPQQVPASYLYEDGEVVPFLAGKTIDWSIKE